MSKPNEFGVEFSVFGTPLKERATLRWVAAPYSELIIPSPVLLDRATLIAQIVADIETCVREASEELLTLPTEDGVRNASIWMTKIPRLTALGEELMAAKFENVTRVADARRQVIMKFILSDADELSAFSDRDDRADASAFALNAKKGAPLHPLRPDSQLDYSAINDQVAHAVRGGLKLPIDVPHSACSPNGFSCECGGCRAWATEVVTVLHGHGLDQLTRLMGTQRKYLPGDFYETDGELRRRLLVTLAAA